MPKYDFYNKPPKTRDDLREYLTSWLEKLTPEEQDYSILEVNGEKFIQEYGFRRGFCMHTVFMNMNTNEYVWWIFNGSDMRYIDTFPTLRFPTYDSMLEHAIDIYYKRWGLVD